MKKEQVNSQQRVDSSQKDFLTKTRRLIETFGNLPIPSNNENSTEGSKPANFNATGVVVFYGIGY
jgi:hypothetical protein